jgi:hypothetical protein
MEVIKSRVEGRYRILNGNRDEKVVKNGILNGNRDEKVVKKWYTKWQPVY